MHLTSVQSKSNHKIENSKPLIYGCKPEDSNN
jgi:hypothetical protein